MTDSTASIAAQSAVIQLGARYCAYVDSGDIDALLGLFAADAEFTVRGATSRGAAELGPFFRKAVRGIHLAGLPWVTEVSPTEVLSVQNFLFVADGASVVTRGTYHDRLRRDAEVCVFLERTVDIHPDGAA